MDKEIYQVINEYKWRLEALGINVGGASFWAVRCTKKMWHDKNCIHLAD
jgi:hypothetical protein